MDTEDVVLMYGTRGMDILRKELPRHYFKDAAEKIADLPRGNVLILTGFYVAGKAETDGPTGAYYLAKGFEKLGFHPIIVTDEIAEGLFPEIPTLCISKADEAACQELLEAYQPVFCLSIERCGRNADNDYTNMRGVSIREHTATLDEIILQAKKSGILTFGIGDGGNEIGMGNLKDIIKKNLDIKPSIVCVDYLMIATVSNWAAYALLTNLSAITSCNILPEYVQVKDYYRYLVEQHCVDGVTKENRMAVDGFSIEIEREILDRLKQMAGESYG